MSTSTVNGSTTQTQSQSLAQRQAEQEQQTTPPPSPLISDAAAKIALTNLNSMLQNTLTAGQQDRKALLDALSQIDLNNQNLMSNTIDQSNLEKIQTKLAKLISDLQNPDSDQEALGTDMKNLQDSLDSLLSALSVAATTTAPTAGNSDNPILGDAPRSSQSSINNNHSYSPQLNPQIVGTVLTPAQQAMLLVAIGDVMNIASLITIMTFKNSSISLKQIEISMETAQSFVMVLSKVFSEAVTSQTQADRERTEKATQENKEKAENAAKCGMGGGIGEMVVGALVMVAACVAIAASGGTATPFVALALAAVLTTGVFMAADGAVKTKASVNMLQDLNNGDDPNAVIMKYIGELSMGVCQLMATSSVNAQECQMIVSVVLGVLTLGAGAESFAVAAENVAMSTLLKVMLATNSVVQLSATVGSAIKPENKLCQALTLGFLGLAVYGAMDIASKNMSEDNQAILQIVLFLTCAVASAGLQMGAMSSIMANASKNAAPISMQVIDKALTEMQQKASGSLLKPLVNFITLLARNSHLIQIVGQADSSMTTSTVGSINQLMIADQVAVEAFIAFGQQMISIEKSAMENRTGSAQNNIELLQKSIANMMEQVQNSIKGLSAVLKGTNIASAFEQSK